MDRLVASGELQLQYVAETSDGPEHQLYPPEVSEPAEVVKFDLNAWHPTVDLTQLPRIRAESEATPAAAPVPVSVTSDVPTVVLDSTPVAPTVVLDEVLQVNPLPLVPPGEMPAPKAKRAKKREIIAEAPIGPPPTL